MTRCGAHKVMKGAHAFLKGPRHPAAKTASPIFSEPWHPGPPAGGMSEWAAQAGQANPWEAAVEEEGAAVWEEQGRGVRVPYACTQP